MVVLFLIEGHVSIRNTEHGSWFIQSLCDVFKNDAHEHSVMDMMTKVCTPSNSLGAIAPPSSV